MTSIRADLSTVQCRCHRKPFAGSVCLRLTSPVQDHNLNLVKLPQTTQPASPNIREVFVQPSLPPRSPPAARAPPPSHEYWRPSLLCLMVMLWKMTRGVTLSHNPPGARHKTNMQLSQPPRWSHQRGDNRRSQRTINRTSFLGETWWWWRWWWRYIFMWVMRASKHVIQSADVWPKKKKRLLPAACMMSSGSDSSVLRHHYSTPWHFRKRRNSEVHRGDHRAADALIRELTIGSWFQMRAEGWFILLRRPVIWHGCPAANRWRCGEAF